MLPSSVASSRCEDGRPLWLQTTLLRTLLAAAWPPSNLACACAPPWRPLEQPQAPVMPSLPEDSSSQQAVHDRVAGPQFECRKRQQWGLFRGQGPAEGTQAASAPQKPLLVVFLALERQFRRHFLQIYL